MNQSVKDYIDEVDSSSPAPGGGSVSALASSLGVALGRMVGHLTFDRKAFSALDEDIQKNYHVNFNQLSKVKEELLACVTKDVEAFNRIMEAYKLPHVTEEEKIIRNKAIEEATYGAIDVPLKIAILSQEALQLLSTMAPYGNRNAISDIGVGALLLMTGIEGALLNVRINLPGLTNEIDRKHYETASEQLLIKSKKMKDHLLEIVYHTLSPSK